MEQTAPTPTPQIAKSAGHEADSRRAGRAQRHAAAVEAAYLLEMRSR